MLPNNLRSAVTSLVGRKAELVELGALLTTHRLVTVAGPGGSGKTRLAAELGLRIVRAPADPPAGAQELWWVDLASATEAAEAVYACARLLGVRLEADGRDPTAALVAGIRDRQAVLVFDTCEHLLDELADLVERILESCAGIRLLATSREPLGIPGEAVWRLPSLSPRDAAELFVQRARLAAHDVDLSPHDPQVAAICDRLDGLPLAIELAAPWTRVFTAAQILAGLDERFRLLTGGLRRGPPRHRTLEASMAWSHDLLGSPEREIFRRLAVFVGEFDLAAVEEVCEARSTTDPEPAELLARLVDKSLLLTGYHDERATYRLLDTVQEYAADKLDQAGGLASARDAHLSWCLGRLRAVDATLRENQDAALRLFDDIDANATAALDWALQPDDDRRAQGRQLAHLMVMPWFLRSQSYRGRPLLNRALAAPVHPDDGMDRLLAADQALLGIVAGRRHEPPETFAAFGQGAADRLARARTGLVYAFDAFFSEHEECERAGIAASAHGREAGDPFTEDFAVIVAAYSLTARERHDEAGRLAAPALARAQVRGDRFCAAFALGIDQYGAMQTGRLADAIRRGRQMTALAAPLGDNFCLGTLTVNHALALCLAGKLDDARHRMEPILRVTESTSELYVVGLPVPMGHICLRAGQWEAALGWFQRGLARLDSSRTDWTAARCLPGAVEALRRLGRTSDATAVADRGQDLGLTAPEFVANLSEQRAHLLPAADPLAHALHRRALDIRIRAGMRTFLPDNLDALANQDAHEHPVDAVRLLAASTKARKAMTYPRPIGDLPDHDAMICELRNVLGPEAFAEAWQSGTALSLDDACQLAQRDRRRLARPGTGWSSLTPAELVVVRLIAQGLTNADIARQLVVSRATVKTHLYHAFSKLSVTTRTELAAMAHTHLPSAEDA